MSAETDITEDMALAEAAAWLSRLQDEARTPATEAAFKEWLLEPRCARAFARVTETWELVAGASLATQRPKPSRPWAPALLAATLLMVVCGGGIAAFVLHDPSYSTAIGQQQTVTLDDGTRVALNTDSKIVVDYTAAQRRVRLERGEAMFEVAKNRNRPFIVAAGDERVRAVGTTFVVRRDVGKTSVVLVEGRVEVSRGVERRQNAGRPPKATILTAGDRLTVTADAAIAVDRPKIETATAWRRGEVMFDDTPLVDAIAELNRYGGAQISLNGPELRGLRVSGVFKTQDPAEFAEIVARLHGLRAERSSEGVSLQR